MKPIPYHNEACASCGVPADVHLSPKDPWTMFAHTEWGDLNRCRDFVRHSPPKAAYGDAWWTKSLLKLSREDDAIILEALSILVHGHGRSLWTAESREAARQILNRWPEGTIE